ncbi:MAG: aminotransferase class I/II-fold pyridoxal phosphate-dependent enzyme, partial [Selenomonadaceae bacterium]|nr:aminotransferase class I/II-fold pyridoxal phosphate-dependent enzyme [Selenomonadaceae bacterium]
MEFAKRMNQFGEGVFSRLAEMRKKRTAAGKEVFDLSIGAPNIPPAKHIMEAIAQAVMEPKNYVYAITDTAELLQAVADWYQRRYDVTLDKDTEICSLLGSQDGLSHIALSILDPGDVMLVPDPCYPIFADGPRIAGAELYYMPQKKEKEYVIQLNEIPEEVAKKAKFMLVSYPNNPTAAMAPESFYHELVAFAKKYDIIVLHDNAYRFLPRYGDRTVDQMVQAARSGKQNIVEGCEDGMTSTEMEIKLINVSRSSIHELREDYEDYLHTHQLTLWDAQHPRYDRMLAFCREHNTFDHYATLAQRLTDEALANMAITV